ncbi:MAG: hypothetical protein LBE34_07805 [Flavobacteriaceae bacterium]|nr:hypothetical protein [Flavobacteriaceae bacterium]
MKNLLLSLLLLFFLSANGQSKHINTMGISNPLDTLSFYDSTRERVIPIAIYQPANNASNIPVILNHGWG